MSAICDTLARKAENEINLQIWFIGGVKREKVGRFTSSMTTDVGLSWGFRSLLGAMYLQLAWRIKSRQCEAPGCNNIIGLHERSNKKTCSLACKERRRYHRN
jgi:hypothetical protein